MLLPSCVERRASAVGSTGSDKELLESLLLLPPPLEAEEAELERSGPPNLLPWRLRDCSSRGPSREMENKCGGIVSCACTGVSYAVPDSAVDSDPR